MKKISRPGGGGNDVRPKASARKNPDTLKGAASPSRLKWTLGIIVAVVGLLLYANTVTFDYTLDDYSVIKANRVTRQGWDAFPQIVTTPYRYGYYFTQDDLYRPVPKAMFAIEWALSPDHASLSHGINVLLYGVTGLLLFFTLSRYVRGNLVVPFVASLLFMAHPIHTEVVASIKSRDEILSLLFLLLSLGALHRFVTPDRQSRGLASKPLLSVMFMTAFLLSLLSKESGVTFLAVFPLAIYFFSDVPVKTAIKTSAMALVPFGLFLAIRYSVLDHTPRPALGAVDNVLMAAQNGSERVATAFSILGTHLKTLFVPHPLVFDRSYNDIPIVGIASWPFLVTALICTGLLAFATVSIKKKDGIAFSILYFFTTVSIFSNLFVIIGTSYGERLMYLPSLGFCLGIAFLLARLFDGNNGTTVNTVGEFLSAHLRVLSLVALIVVVYAVKTETRNRVWQDNYTLFSNDVTLAPNSARTHYLLGNLLSNPDDLGRKDAAAQQVALDTAIGELKRAVEINPAFADAHNQLGVAYFQKKDVDNAFNSFAKALQYNPANATYHSNMGLVYSARNDIQGSLNAFQKAVALDPNYTEGLANLGSTYGMLKDYDNAEKYLLQCIRTAPDYARAYYFLSLVYKGKGDQASADLYLKKYQSIAK